MMTIAQAEVLAFIKRYQSENDGVSPSFEEMKEASGLASKSGIYRILSALEERGYITRLANRARAIIVHDNTQRDLRDVPTTALIRELADRKELKRRAA